MDPIQQAILDECAEKLGEHFEGVLILVCHKEAERHGEGSSMTAKLRGNTYAALGMAHDYLERDRATMTGREVKEALDGDV